MKPTATEYRLCDGRFVITYSPETEVIQTVLDNGQPFQDFTRDQFVGALFSRVLTLEAGALSVYQDLLRLPLSARLRMQITLYKLCNYIATATGRSAEDIQREFENERR